MQSSPVFSRRISLAAGLPAGEQPVISQWTRDLSQRSSVQPVGWVAISLSWSGSFTNRTAADPIRARVTLGQGEFSLPAFVVDWGGVLCVLATRVQVDAVFPTGVPNDTTLGAEIHQAPGPMPSTVILSQGRTDSGIAGAGGFANADLPLWPANISILTANAWPAKTLRARYTEPVDVGLVRLVGRYNDGGADAETWNLFQEPVTVPPQQPTMLLQRSGPLAGRVWLEWGGFSL